jgi:hypothetical protein
MLEEEIQLFFNHHIKLHAGKDVSTRICIVWIALRDALHAGCLDLKLL